MRKVSVPAASVPACPTWSRRLTFCKAERLRGRAGQRQRLRRLQRTNGLCERCHAAGRTVAATVVDHIRPLALGGLDVDDNTRNLCDPCHLDVTAEQFGHAEPIGARGVGSNGRPTSPDHPWNGGRPADRPAAPARRLPTPGAKSKDPPRRTPVVSFMRSASISRVKVRAESEGPWRGNRPALSLRPRLLLTRRSSFSPTGRRFCRTRPSRLSRAVIGIASSRR
ncbi:HNH endonuclease signature motif containing protein [Sphingomonas sp. I4]